MRLAASIAAFVAAATAGTLARADSPRECGAVPRPAAADIEPMRRSGPYAAGWKAWLAGREAVGGRELAAAWTRVRGDLAKAFSTTECREATIEATLGRRVFASPPQAVAGEDRYLPPRAVALAIATARCASGDPGGAATWLVDSTSGDDAPARAAAAVLWASSGRPDAARALVPAGASGPPWDAVRRAIEARADRSPTHAPVPETRQ